MARHQDQPQLETTNGGGALKSQIKKSASHSREVAWTLKFESFQSTESKDPPKDAITLDGESLLPMTPYGGWWLLRTIAVLNS